MDPNFRNVRVGLAVAYWMKGEHAKSVEERAKALELGGLGEFAQTIRTAFAAKGWQGYLEAEAHRYDGLTERTIERTSYYSEAIILAALGKKDEAFEALNRSFEAEENPSLVFLKSEPRFDPLRDDPRFAALLKRVGFPD